MLAPGVTRPASRSALATAELAILLPFLAFAFVAAVDFCRVFYATQIVQTCAYSGALYASNTALSSDTPQVAAQKAAVAAGANLSPPLTAAQVSYTPPDGNNVVTVTVSYPFSTIANMPGIPSTLTITRSARMVVTP